MVGEKAKEEPEEVDTVAEEAVKSGKMLQIIVSVPIVDTLSLIAGVSHAEILIAQNVALCLLEDE